MPRAQTGKQRRLDVAVDHVVLLLDRIEPAGGDIGLEIGGVTLLAPIARILPAFFRSSSAPIVSAIGVVGSCQWVM